jgi:hypothetical protein
MRQQAKRAIAPARRLSRGVSEASLSFAGKTAHSGQKAYSRLVRDERVEKPLEPEPCQESPDPSPPSPPPSPRRQPKET